MAIKTNIYTCVCVHIHMRFPRWYGGKESACQCRRCGFNPCGGKIPWRKETLPTPKFLPGEFHGQRNLVGYCPWGHKTVGHDWATEHTYTYLLTRFIFITVSDFWKCLLKIIAKRKCYQWLLILFKRYLYVFKK